MGRSWISMALLGHRLKRRGYETHLFGYRPRRPTLDELSRALRSFVGERVRASVYLFIGHSLGNVIVRNGFREGFRPGLGRIVMLAPPNGPAKLAGNFRENRLFRFWTGDSGQKLGDAEFYRALPVPTVEFGVIAGDRGHHLGFDEPNDGVVSVEGAKLEGMSDFVVLHHTHTLIMMASDTAELCQRFLENGSFTRAS
ncbi:MAG: esterase/lipase family protein [Vicinamibacteria bacterium]